ncbi:MAG: short-subunit dehydrogenase [bacterium]|jgi:short-subunit dehydrogenase
MQGKNVVIFGATGGLGSHLAQTCSTAGAKVYLLGRNQTKLEALAQDLSLPEEQWITTPSLHHEKDIQSVLKSLRNRIESIDIGIHAAGKGILKKSSKITMNDWDEVMNGNLKSAFAFARIVQNLKSPTYDLVFLGSAGVEQTWPKNTLYGSAKAGLSYFAGSLQKEIHQEGGRVWLYQLGSVNTPFFDQLPNHLPKEKMLQPKEVATLITQQLQNTPTQIFYQPLTLLSHS